MRTKPVRGSGSGSQICLNRLASNCYTITLTCDFNQELFGNPKFRIFTENSDIIHFLCFKIKNPVCFDSKISLCEETCLGDIESVFIAIARVNQGTCVTLSQFNLVVWILYLE